MDDHRRETLIASQNPDTLPTASPEKLLAQFKKRLEVLKDEEFFIAWDDCDYFARRLLAMVEEYVSFAPSPEIGLEMVKEFFLCDEAIIERCDDHKGVVRDVFKGPLTHLFHAYAKEVENRTLVRDTLAALSLEDYYGVREHLITHARESLSNEEIRALISHFQQIIEHLLPASQDRVVTHMMASLAAQINDIELYEQIVLGTFGMLHQNAMFTLAEMHVRRGEFDKALERLDGSTTGYNHRANMMRREIHHALGNQEQVIALCKETFDHSRSKEDFEQLISVAGEDFRVQLLAAESARIEASHHYHTNDLDFLIYTEQFDKAAHYLFTHRDEVSGDSYDSLFPFAESLLAHGYLLAATLLNRKLLDSILRRGVTDTYGDGVLSLCILDEMAERISEWAPLETHTVYTRNLYAQHKRKRSFWSWYRGSTR